MIDNRTTYRDYLLPNEANKMRTEDLPRLISTFEALDDDINTLMTTKADSSYVDAAIASLVGTAGAALDTLGELADALADDANYAATVTTALAGKQPLHALLTDISAQTIAAGSVLFGETSSAWDVAPSTSYGRSIWNVANEAAFKSLVNIEAADILASLLTVDGSGSGIDADTLDGYNVGTSGGVIGLLNGNNTHSGNVAFSGTTSFTGLTNNFNATTNGSPLLRLGGGSMLSNTPGFAHFGRNAYYDDTAVAYKIYASSSAGWSMLRVGETNIQHAGAAGSVTAAATITPTWNTVWTSGNDGSGSGLDGDLIRGVTPSAYFLTLVDDADAATARTTLGALASSSYTAADVLSKLLTVDGSGSGLDADTLRGFTPTAFFLSLVDDANAGAALTTLGALAASSYTAADVLSKLLTVDGSGSGIDADLLDGNNIGTSGTAIPLLSGANTWGASQIFSGVTVSSLTIGAGSGSVLAGYTSADTAITALVPGTTAGTIISGTSNGHFVVGIKGNDNTDGFYVIDTNNGGAGAYARSLFRASGNALEYLSNTIWHAGNDGSGSGLDADTLRGTTPSAFMLTVLDDADAATARTTLGVLSSSSYTAADVLSKLLTVDGAASGLDADLFDGYDSTIFPRKAENATITGAWTFAPITTTRANQGTHITIERTGASASTATIANEGNLIIFDYSANGYRFSTAGTERLTIGASTLTYLSNTIWHAGNDGSGSGLDADTLDGNNIGTSGAAIGLLNAANTHSGLNTFSGNTTFTGHFRLSTGFAFPSDYWSGNAFFLPFGVLGTHGSNDTVLSSNAYRNNVSSNTNMAAGGSTGWAMLRLLPTGNIELRSEDGATGTYPTARYTFDLATTTHSLFGTAYVSGALELGSTSDTTVARSSAGNISVEGNVVWHAGNDGSGSTLDAGLIRGTTPSAFMLTVFDDADAATARTTLGALASSSYTAADVLSKLLTVDGSGSGLDADTLDGNNIGTSGAAIPLLNAANTFSANTFVVGSGAASNLIIGAAQDYAAQLYLRGNSGQNRQVRFETGTSLRWVMATNSVAESGSNAGSDFALTSYDDTGASLGSAFTVARATRILNFLVNPTVTGNAIWHAGNDGSGSGLDADTLRGTTPSAFGLTLIDDANAAAALTTLGALASSSYTAADVLSKLLTVDGSGSGLDADTLDGNNIGTSGAAIPLLSASNTFGANQSIQISGSASVLTVGHTAASSSSQILLRGAAASFRYVGMQTGTALRFAFGMDNTAESGSNAGGNFFMQTYDDAGTYLGNVYTISRSTRVVNYAVNPTSNGSAIWNSGNDGSGSGLDADILRGVTPSAFMLTVIDDADAATARTTLGALASASYTAADVLSKLLTVDGSGTGLDADLLDGNNIGTSGTAVPLLSGTNTWGAAQSINVNATTQFTIQRTDAGTSGAQIDAIHDSSSPAINDSPFTLRVLGKDSGANTTVYGRLRFFLTNVTDGAEAGYWQIAPTTAGAETAGLAVTGTTATFNANTMWHAGNDGAGSTLDADLLDGLNSTAFAVLANANTFAGNITVGTFANPRVILNNNSGTAATVQLGADSGAGFVGTFTNANFNIYTNSTLRASFLAAGGMEIGGNAVWNAGNDGSGSGLDADLLDGNNIGTSGTAIPLLSNANTWGGGNQTFNYGASGTSAVLIGGANDNAAALYLSSNAAQTRTIIFRTGGNWRWAMGAGSQAESGSDAGSSFSLTSYNDAGTTIGNIFTAVRSTRILSFNVTPVVGSDTIWHAGNDGSGTGLDADLLDGYNIGTSGSAIGLLDGANTYSGLSTFSNAIISSYTTNGAPVFRNSLAMFSTEASSNMAIGRNAYYDATAATYKIYGGSSGGWGVLNIGGNVLQYAGVSGTVTGGTSITPTFYNIWHAGNDGSGTGLDADLWDGNQFASYLDQAVLTTSTVTFGNATVTGTITSNATSTRDKIRVWNGSPYTIGMQNSITYGHLNGYATTFQMDNTANRGWWWGTSSHTVAQGAMALRNDGYLFVGTEIAVANTSNKVWHLGNDGSGSGLDADLLDGNNIGTSGTAIPLLSGANSWGALQTFNSAIKTYINGAGTHITLERHTSSPTIATIANSGNQIIFDYNGTGYQFQTAATTRFAVSTSITASVATTISTATTGALLSVTSTDAGAAAHGIDIFRDSASPTTNDIVSQIRMLGRTSTAAQAVYGRIYSYIQDATNGSLDSGMVFETYTANTIVASLTLGITAQENRFASTTNSIVSSVGASGYGAFQAVGSGTNSAYMFFNNVTTGELARIAVDNSKNFIVSMNGGSTSHMAITSSGAATFAGDVTGNSDERLKENIERITDAMSIIRQIDGVRFNRIDDAHRSIGVLAQQLIKAGASELVHTNPDGFLSVAYGNAFGLTVEGIKDVDSRVSKLENIIAKQAKRIAKLEARAA